MLYERWRDVARARRNETALRDPANDLSWTFAQLEAATEKSRGEDGPVAFPQSRSAHFLVAVLRAWRQQQMVCPLEISQSPPALDVLPAGCVHLKLTSATTGPARLIALTAAQLSADADNIVTTMGLRPDWPNLGVISLAHSYGFSNLVLPLLLHGIPLVLAPSPLPEAMRSVCSTIGAVTLPAVPALWRTWHEANAIPAHVRLAISAGAPLPLPLEQAVLTASGLKIHNFYGASECGGIAYDDSPLARTDPACVGRPLRQVELGLAPDGCLEIQSAAVAQTYWPQPQETLGHGRFKTSDLAELTDGLVFLRGRTGDQINIAGRKVLPETIEEALLTYPGVRECLVFGAPSGDAERGEMIVACVAAPPTVSADALRQFLLATLPAWQVPREWVFLKALPVNHRGKLSRAEWRQQFITNGGPTQPSDPKAPGSSAT
jgi:acyl-CoA synthetase (AMP-forming)/AMP-acid ligase II